MAAQLAAERKGVRARAVIAAVVVFAALAGFASWRALNSGPDVLHGTVALVNANGSKFCVTQESGGDQWCGALATSGGEPPTVGQTVTVLVNTVDTDPGRRPLHRDDRPGRVHGAVNGAT